MIRHIFFNGFHPVFPWTAFMLVGLWLGRQDMTNPKFRKRVLLTSALVVGLTELASRIFVQVFSKNAPAAEQEIVVFLFGTGPMPPMPFYLLSGGGTAIIIITLCIILTEKFAGARWLQPIVATGQLALTNYVAHVVIGMGVLDALGLLFHQSLPFALGNAVAFCATAVLLSHFWRRRFARGPVELVMRRVSG